ncbi:helix-turn-helix domain-containing protein [Siphonobacter aquaeclarae]|uniref:Helix-turn-helix domain-containing protein n=1 Tax=Siphonobacter aquaeclarae TaxID=563176 RepID=A0A1G9NHS2_9BACT|nr:helix-turn-helix transcriptional regulator [Siphonobacter aquaeclarae]SDL85900.1 Helix-turn-helix domain-containing protein [Siphonobacter aquaeclarae]
MAKTIHQGRNVKRFREMLGIKQEALALGLGDEWNQQKISLLEQKETLEQGLLEQVAKVLKVPVEAIRNFDEEVAIQNIQNNYDNAIVHAGPGFNYYCSFNPLDKLMELVEENRRLYERLLESEKRTRE